MIIGFVQREHLLVQLVLKKMDRSAKLRATSGTNEYPPAEKPTWLSQTKGDHHHIGNEKNGVHRLNSVHKASDLKQNQKLK